MSMFDAILGQMGNNPMLQNIGERVGLTPEQVATAVSALTQAHPQPGDTVDTAAEQTGLPAGTLSQVLEHLGGEGALGQIAGSLGGGQGEQGGAGGLLGSLGGLASGFFGGNKGE